MFVLFIPLTRQFVDSVVPAEPLPLLYFARVINPTAILPDLEAAKFMALEVQAVYHAEKMYHVSIQVLPLGPNYHPNYNAPAFELPAFPRPSVN